MYMYIISNDKIYKIKNLGWNSENYKNLAVKYVIKTLNIRLSLQC